LGPGIFSDDTARDIRDEFRDLIGEGLAGDEATRRLIEHWGDLVEDPDVRTVFWLSLAATQWSVGRLEDSVRDQALRIIEDGSDLARWDSDRRRRAALEKLERQLRSPQPPMKKIRKRYVQTCEWQIGEVLAYIQPSGNRVLFRVVGYHEDLGGRAPICEILECPAGHLPSPKEAATLPARRPLIPIPGGRDCAMLGATSERQIPRDRIRSIYRPTEPSASDNRPGYVVFFWKRIDAGLSTVFGIQ